MRNDEKELDLHPNHGLLNILKNCYQESAVKTPPTHIMESGEERL